MFSTLEKSGERTKWCGEERKVSRQMFLEKLRADRLLPANMQLLQFFVAALK